MKQLLYPPKWKIIQQMQICSKFELRKLFLFRNSARIGTKEVVFQPLHKQEEK